MTVKRPARNITDEDVFALRWRRGRRDLIGPVSRLYGPGATAEALLERIRTLLAGHWADRPADLKRLDMARDVDPDWFLSQEMAAYVFYIDRLAGDLKSLPDRIPYLQELGITYAHMMPCLMPRPGQSDGGYAVMDYRRIDPKLGTMAQFRAVTAKLRRAGISPCIDMVLNHTAKEHDWARKARAGDPHYQAFYRMFDDDSLPRDYEKTLLEIFPAQAPGNFTWYDDIPGPNGGKWVWTTFNEYQWDLNWENPEVFLAILDMILHLANQGVEVFRLDAVAFMWKRMGTICQNLPEVHDILQALTQATRIAAPAGIHKAEAIVGPADLVPYLGTDTHQGRESQLAYHNNLMVQFWASLAARDTRLMTYVLRAHFPESFRRACFATYIRCHDDIGWAVTEEDAAHVPGISGPGHRTFLADFYAGRFPGSFARGADFQVNEATGDRRTNGSFAALAGLESALEAGDAAAVDAAVARILMGHALIAGFGGIPLIYMGDELGLLNDHAYRDDPEKAEDGRWMQRPPMDWDKAAERHDATTPHGRIWRGLRHVLAVRRATEQLASNVPTRILDAGNRGLFAWARLGDDRTVTGLCNFTEHPQAADLEIPADAVDLLTGAAPARQGARVEVPPYGCLWLRA
ncbi:alpha-amylase family glycosyl hydrolase [Jannaschia ovalis]|uniref:Alpha-amylase family glycosyl hydrolase n=1 Tax=Jannaschia ovalis TaxID=3038773 RepID=A0ABY8LAJ4_9RHOB|nr:alpha-amylase family glycosyl hydrolase [Jannaschia sp. GRR-S6-38]WGH77188.1 alpha-amylase family glycosyl hydrolase [Jannaschia sp. GRR-S6-38]